MKKRKIPAWVLIAAVATVVTLFATWQALAARADNKALRSEIDSVRDEADRRLGVMEEIELPELRAPLATWSHMVRGLHHAAGEADLNQFSYTSGTVIALSDPRFPLAQGVDLYPGEEAEISEYTDPDQDEPDGASLPYRAMTVEVRGAGGYADIVAFTDALARLDTPLYVDRLQIIEGVGLPRFEGRLYLVTSLPVETKPVTVQEDAS
ncbi:hypothetical protein ABI59_18985 [Acidobacteria bacterium Mor1]|nr:hypothetical protein ABI59_18985 [Acidobacteria bacterium Mor1]